MEPSSRAADNFIGLTTEAEASHSQYQHQYSAWPSTDFSYSPMYPIPGSTSIIQTSGTVEGPLTSINHRDLRPEQGTTNEMPHIPAPRRRPGESCWECRISRRRCVIEGTDDCCCTRCMSRGLVCARPSLTYQLASNSSWNRLTNTPTWYQVPRRRQAVACDNCRQRKIRCSLSNPDTGCDRCVSLGCACAFTYVSEAQRSAERILRDTRRRKRSDSTSPTTAHVRSGEIFSTWQQSNSEASQRNNSTGAGASWQANNCLPPLLENEDGYPELREVSPKQ